MKVAEVLPLEKGKDVHYGIHVHVHKQKWVRSIGYDGFKVCDAGLKDWFKKKGVDATKIPSFPPR